MSLQNKKGIFKRYVLFDGTICIRKTARLQNGEINITYNVVEQPSEEWLHTDKVGDYRSRKVNQTP